MPGWDKGSCDQHVCTAIAHSQCAGTPCKIISSGFLAAGALGYREKRLAWKEGQMEYLPWNILVQGVRETGRQSKTKLKGEI